MLIFSILLTGTDEESSVAVSVMALPADLLTPTPSSALSARVKSAAIDR
jgi:hypothetical protein